MNIRPLWSLPCLLLLALVTCDDEDDTGAAGGSGGQPPGGGAGAAGLGGSAQGGSAQGGSAQAGAGGGGAGPDAGAQAIPSTVGLELVAEGLTSPLVIQQAPGDRLFVADQIGTIRVIDASGQLAQQALLDISDRMVTLNPGYDERGLLGLALHPDFANNGRLFLYYSAPLRAGGPEGYNHTSHVSEFQVTGNGTSADPGSERILLQIDKPQANHNGGQIAFGPDGYLYISLGDGGAADDVGLGHVEDWYETNEGGNGQDLEQSLLGSILRIDVNAGDPYAVPQDNPFAESEAPEVWAYGLRNPYRMSFDRGTGQLFVGEVGQNLWEEIDIVTRGGNYGWNVKEGTHCFSTATPSEALAECPSQDPDGVPLIDPILEYPHPENAPANGPEDIAGLSVIGGIVYRGSALPGLVGRYVFGDWSTSFGAPNRRLFVASPPENEGGAWTMAPLAIDAQSGELGESLLSFGEDTAGELYVLTSGEGGPAGDTGKVYRLVP
jgi:glucose/arabinose dehydrogenase